MKTAVIGGGWAGMAAAATLCQHGLPVHVYEAAPQAGGRARTVVWPNAAVSARTVNAAAPLITDNGQHLLLGAYQHTLELMQSLGLDTTTLFYRSPLTIEQADGSFRLAARRAPAPWHLAYGLLTAHGISWPERWALTRQLSRVQKIIRQSVVGPRERTVLQWLKQGKQSDHLIRTFWAPLCVAAMNTAPAEADTLLFCRVLTDSLQGSSEASDLLIPTVPLGELWCTTVTDKLRTEPHRFLPGQAVQRLEPTDQNQIVVHTQSMYDTYDHVIIATPPRATLKLLSTLPDQKPLGLLKQQLAMFEYRPIATLTLLLEQPWKAHVPMLMLREHPEQQQFGQWLFNHAIYDGHPRLSVVISDAEQAAHIAPDELARGVITQIAEQTQRFANTLPAIADYKLIIEKRATFAALPGLKRPGTHTPYPCVWLAGDWTDTGYPAVLEGAVRSGQQAAHAVIAQQNAA